MNAILILIQRPLVCVGLIGIGWIASHAHLESQQPTRIYSNLISDEVNGDECPMWGGTPSRNLISNATGLNWDFDLKAGKNVAWTVRLGSQTYGGATVAGGKVLVGTNNGGDYRPAQSGDRGVVLCFDETNGELVWQLTRDKLDDAQSLDFPEVGISSIAAVEGDRAWLVTNRCELMCVDLNGFHDDENDGEFKSEASTEKLDADIVWNLDMLKDLGVQPHFLATSSPIVFEELVLICTSQGITNGDHASADPDAPSFLAVNKLTGEVVWKDNSPGKGILDGQWSSPCLGVVNGQAQVVFPAGDGWVYAFEPKTGNPIWKCDLNPKESVWEEGGVGTRNSIVATPVFVDNSVLIGVGQNPDHGDGTGHLWRIDATKTGDVSAEIGEAGGPGQPNPNTGIIWHYGGDDDDKGTVTGQANESIFYRTISTVAVSKGLVFAADRRGQVHCVDFATGKRYWAHDLMSTIWGSPLVADDHVLIGTEDGKLTLFKATKDAVKIVREYDTKDYASIYSTPVIAHGDLFLVDRVGLTRIKLR